MPLDSQFNNAARQQHWELSRSVGWKLKFCIFPQKCFLTGKLLWLRRAYNGGSLIVGPGGAFLNNYWLDKNEFLIWNLTRN
jgi:hypothetical protein